MVTVEKAKYGAAASASLKGKLPGPFPRILGPRTAEYLMEVVESGLTSDMVSRFEKAFATELGVKHCIAAPGCTPSLAMLASALEFEPGDEVVVSPITDYGTLQGIIRENYIPVFADTAPGSINLSAETIEPCLSDRTRAIICVHKTGLMCDMDPILKLAAKHNLVVIEDCCQAVFSTYKGRLAGTIGLAGAFSFDSEKTMGSDTGGCVVTDDDDLAERMRFYGQSRGARMQPHFGRLHVVAGYAFRMPLCTAAVTLGQLEIARDNVARRDRMIRLQSELMSRIPGIRPLPIPMYQQVYSCWMVGISLEPGAFACSAEEFAGQLAAEGLTGAGIGNYYLMPEALTFLNENARAGKYPYSMPPASHSYRYDESTCPTAHAFLQNLVRWSTFSEKYRPEHCELASEIVRTVADRNRT